METEAYEILRLVAPSRRRRAIWRLLSASGWRRWVAWSLSCRRGRRCASRRGLAGRARDCCRQKSALRLSAAQSRPAGRGVAGRAGWAERLFNGDRRSRVVSRRGDPSGRSPSRHAQRRHRWRA